MLEIMTYIAKLEYTTLDEISLEKVITNEQN